jgi:predicted nucleic acid-binding protein
LNIVDSSGWLEYFADGPNAGHFAAPLQDRDSLVVSAISIYEVFRVVSRENGENAAFRAIAAMRAARVVDVSPALAVSAARLASRHGLPMADSLILATAHASEALLWTQDAHFENLPGVNFLPKK